MVIILFICKKNYPAFSQFDLDYPEMKIAEDNKAKSTRMIGAYKFIDIRR
jgi:hypothetical protein